MFWIGLAIAKKSWWTAARKLSYLWDCWETCPPGLTHLHYITWTWAIDFPKKQTPALTALLNKAILRPQLTCDPVNLSHTLCCAKKVFFLGSAAQFVQLTPPGHSFQQKPLHRAAARSILKCCLPLEAWLSYNLPQFIVIYRHLWERDSLGKRALSLLSGLTSELFLKPEHLLWHPFQTFAITHCDRGESSHSSRSSQDQEARKPWKQPSRILPASSDCRNSSSICTYQLQRALKNSLGEHLLWWKHRGQFCFVSAVCEHCHQEPSQKGMQVQCLRLGQAAMVMSEPCT